MNLGKIFKRKKRQLTLEEIRVVREIYERKNCGYCRYLFADLNLWCGYDGAIKARRTRPGVNPCPYWGADKSYIRKVLKNRNVKRIKENFLRYLIT